MTGRHVQADLLASEDVVSLLIDDAQLEQKLRDAPLHLVTCVLHFVGFSVCLLIYLFRTEIIVLDQSCGEGCRLVD